MAKKRRTIKKRKKRKYKRKTSLKNRVFAGLKIAIVLSAVFYFVFFFLNHKISYRSIVAESDNLYKYLQTHILERRSAFKQIEKNIEVQVSRGVKYKEVKINLKLEDGINPKKLAIAFSNGLPEGIWFETKSEANFFHVFYFLDKVKVAELVLISSATARKLPKSKKIRKSNNLNSMSKKVLLAIVIDDVGNNKKYGVYRCDFRC